jgi:hypothetical protein
VWIPELQKHANGASRIVAIEILSADPKAAAEHMSRLIDEPASSANGAWRLHSGGKRADFLFYDAAGFAQRYPAAARAGAVPEGAAALVIGTTDLAATTKALGPAGIAHDGMVSVPASAANGTIVSFVAQ